MDCIIFEIIEEEIFKYFLQFIVAARTGPFIVPRLSSVIIILEKKACSVHYNLL